MLNQFLFKKDNLDFDFKNLIGMNFNELNDIGKKLEETFHLAEDKSKIYFHGVLNKILQASFEHRCPEKLDMHWQAQYIEKICIDLWLTQEINLALKEWQLPQENENLADWFNSFIDKHWASRHPLFEYITNKVTEKQLAYYIFQENPSDANFEDLIVSLQLGVGNPNTKMELARNYWDEMGVGDIDLVHTELYNHFLKDIKNRAPEFNNEFSALPEALATGNVLLYFCKYRSNRNYGVGVLGVIEKLFAEASTAVVGACQRLNIETQLYHRTHCIIDVEHTKRWQQHVFEELEKEGWQTKKEIALGAILRLNIIGNMYNRIYQSFLAGNYQ